MRKRGLLLFAAIAGVVAMLVRRQREIDLDEAIWEEAGEDV
ncbi:MAG TPA: hypothetical protein VML96_13940 [Egibacteraceae bacterium]|nr:hypothetical protein [Egibacteraceae bacterium]